jgi:hypothetical protein
MLVTLKVVLFGAHAFSGASMPASVAPVSAPESTPLEPELEVDEPLVDDELELEAPLEDEELEELPPEEVDEDEFSFVSSSALHAATDAKPTTRRPRSVRDFIVMSLTQLEHQGDELLRLWVNVPCACDRRPRSPENGPPCMDRCRIRDSWLCF